MKKFFMLSALLSIFILTGCVKNYKTVEEYSDAMNVIRKGNSSYTIEAIQKSGTIELYNKSSFKGNKWKNEVSTNKGSSYMQTVLWNGKELLSYNTGSPYALINPINDMLENEDKETKDLTINSMNPLYGMYNWTNGTYLLHDLDIKQMVFLNNKDTRNGFKCRLIKMSSDIESCINDEYGIAVYQKLNTTNPKTGADETLEINVIKIDTADIPDSTFKLPKGIKKMDMDTMLNNLSRIFKK